MFAFIFLVNIFCAIVAAAIAYLKGRSVTGWFLAGLILGVIGLLVAARVPKLEECPQCGTKVRQGASTCYYCGYGLAENLRQNNADEYRYCSNCQRAVDKNALICPVCGAALD